MKNKLIEISNKEAAKVNGGGEIRDIYDIILLETDDFLKGFWNGFKKGFK